jgi:phosphoesterase RecJ-like protein
VTLLLREVGPSETRVSIRTADGVDAMRIAAAFGGGGHVRRAGCTISREVAASLDEVLAVASSVVAGEA